jgi:hypothetical protein
MLQNAAKNSLKANLGILNRLGNRIEQVQKEEPKKKRYRLA